jgi:ribosomal protein S18 acetylase RimI-like enzyme
LSDVHFHDGSGARALDLQILRYLTGAAARYRDVERVGPFTATFDRDNRSPYLNYAIPDADARPSLEDVAALADAYRRRGRVPRLEYPPAAAPAVEATLVAGGFAVEAHLPVMTCTPATVVDLVSEARGFVVAVPESDADWRGLRRAQDAAFATGTDVGGGAGAGGADAGGGADSSDDAADLAHQRERLASGGLALLARDTATGAIVGGGVATVPDEGITEIAGIGVLEEHRRRGIAGAITSGLARAAFAAGLTTVWLTPGDDGAHRVYERAGFADTTSVVHLSAPAA